MKKEKKLNLKDEEKKQLDVDSRIMEKNNN